MTRAAETSPGPEAAATGPAGPGIELTVVMPCLNEAETLESCIRKAQAFLERAAVRGEVLVADNGSTDGSGDVARRVGARVVEVPEKGYGAALMGGIRAAQGTYVIMGDSDDSYDFSQLDHFLEKLRQGYDLVMGNRFRGGIRPGAMPALHRYLGNPVLTGIGRLFFASPSRDFHCGLRGLRRSAALAMDLRTTGMEFASEMVVKAAFQGLKVTEVPTTLSPDGRSRAPHLRSWRDGWRHLRFLLLFSTRFLFLYPGLVLVATGSALALWLLPGPRTVGAVTLDVHTLLFAAAAIFLGVQAVLFSLFTKVFATSEGFLPPDPRLDRLFRYLTLEAGLLLGGAFFMAGVACSVYAFADWGARSFRALDTARTLRVVIPAVLLMILGVQGILGSFFVSILLLRRR
jgi:hypothetical protein